MANHTDKEKVRFLKDEYGIGGRSHALSGATHSGEDHDGKGLHYNCLLYTSAIRQGMSEVQTVSATVHEIAHSKLHDPKKYEKMCIRDRCHTAPQIIPSGNQRPAGASNHQADAESRGS